MGEGIEEDGWNKNELKETQEQIYERVKMFCKWLRQIASKLHILLIREYKYL